MAQYYTSVEISDLLVKQLGSLSPSNILDIGCGDSNLLVAAGARWKKANLFGIDIDPVNISKTHNKLTLLSGDGFDPNLYHKIIETCGEIDLSVSNPPYLSIDYTKKEKHILSLAGFDKIIGQNIRFIPSELVFLAQNLRVMKPNAELAIILPAGLISGVKWQTFRDFILNEFDIQACIQLPQNAFKKTEASTFALILKKAPAQNKKIKISNINSSIKYDISREDAIKRMDYQYYSQPYYNVHLGLSSADDIEIFRGNLSNKQLRESGLDYIHTQDLSIGFNEISRNNQIESSPMKYAVKGDILIARVGTRCIGRVSYLKKGKLPISDCVFVIRTKNSNALWNSIKSSQLTDFLKFSALGVGAKYITIEMLKEIFNEK